MEYSVESIKSSLKNRKVSRIFYREKYRAAVILPILEIDRGIHILFEVRSDSLSRHPGQISFPGGGIEQGENAFASALRELEEECGILPAHTALIGELDTVENITGAVVTPFVCYIDKTAQIKLQYDEVKEVFTIPLKKLLAEGLRESKIKEVFSLADDFPSEFLYGKEWKREYIYPVYYYRYGRHFIWGLTARILKHFLEIIV